MQGRSIDYFDAATGKENGIAIATDAEKNSMLQAKIWLKSKILIQIFGFCYGVQSRSSNCWAFY